MTALTEDTRAEQSFRAALRARMARPALLDPRAVESVLAHAVFRPRADMGGSGAASQPYERHGDVAVVRIDGALAQHAADCWCWSIDGYDAVQNRVQAALDDPSCASVLLRINSPGGEVAGCFEGARAMRAASLAAGKPLLAYVDEQATSAAYALACACEHITLPDTGIAGSIGVICTVADESGALALEGYKVNLITSGAAKADGHPAVPLGEDARARIQGEVTYLAQVFAAEVAGARGLDAAEVLGLEAQVFLGPGAVAEGLADALGNFNDALAVARQRGAQRREERMNAQMNAALGLSADATDEQALARVASLKALQGDHATPEAAAGALAALQVQAAEVPALRAALTEAQSKAAAETRERKLDAAVRKGQLTREATDARWQHAQSLSDAQLDGFLATLQPRGAKVDAKPQPAPSASTEASVQLTPDELAIAKQMGNDPQKVLAAKREHLARQGVASALDPQLPAPGADADADDND